MGHPGDDASRSWGRARRRAARLKQFADPTRLAVLLRLAAGDCPAGTLVEAAGCKRTAVSRHLAFLRLDGLVASRGAGRLRLYDLTASARRPVLLLVAWVARLVPPPD